MSNDAATILDALEQTWRSTIDVCRGLTEDEWDRATGCPGWSVKDNLSHIVGLELELGGEPLPDHAVPADLPHVTGPVGQHMEIAVDVRRDRAGAEVLAEMEAVTSRRLADLRALPDETWQGEMTGPMGSSVPALPFLGIRVFDCWAHEQDIRRALGRPGHLDGPAAELSRDRVASGLGFVVGKKAGAPEGTTVALHVTGPSAASFGAEVVDGRGQPTAEVPADPTVSITIEFPEFMALACGRTDADPSAAKIEGDAQLGARIVASLAVTP